jgi:hypothetical protein
MQRRRCPQYIRLGSYQIHSGICGEIAAMILAVRRIWTSYADLTMGTSTMTTYCFPPTDGLDVSVIEIASDPGCCCSHQVMPAYAPYIVEREPLL